MRGMFYALGAYAMWGCFPLFFSLLAHVGALEVLSYRIVFAFLFTLALLAVNGQIQTFGRLLKDKKALQWSLLASVLISINWFVFIWAVAEKRVIETSLGYFITPLVSLLIGRIVLREQISALQLSAGVVAATAIAFELSALGGLPWVSLVLAFSFGFYGLVRKIQPIESLMGLSLETLWVLPLATVFIGRTLVEQGLNYELTTYFVLVGSGVVTAVPLLLFASSVRQVNLVVAGFIMYLNPLMQFVSAVWILNETVPTQRYFTFVLVWVAMGLFVLGLIQKKRKISPGFGK